MIYDCDISGDYPSTGWFELRGFAFFVFSSFLALRFCDALLPPRFVSPFLPPSFYLFSLTLLPYLFCSPGPRDVLWFLRTLDVGLADSSSMCCLISCYNCVAF
jgi:hypothetical protein